MIALADALPDIGALPGRVQRHAPLKDKSWFRVGGPAEILAKPASLTELQALMTALPPSMPVMPIGAASNLIIRDGGIPGVVVRLGRGFADIVVERDGLMAGAACLDATIAEHAASAGLAGLEFLIGIPGTVGGAVAMNAGAYGGDMAGCLDWAEIVLRSGELVRVGADRLRLTYRHAALPPGGVIVRARFRATAGDANAITARMTMIRTNRETTQPVRARTGGSTYRNPPNMKAWELIDAAGCRGLRHGDAQISEKHTNFLLNLGDATAADLEALGEDVRRRVLTSSGVKLMWEIKRVGVPA